MKIKGVPKGNSITMNTNGGGKSKDKDPTTMAKWWINSDDRKLCEDLLSTAAFLKTSQQYRFKQAATYARLYGNMSLFNFLGSNVAKMESIQGLPTDRPTFNLIQSAVDTLVSRISQSKPAPVFLTDNSDYKERNLAKKLNNFILGEFHQSKAYEKTEYMLRDALVEGTGCLKVFETADSRVGLDRVLLTELFTDPSESLYGEPRQLYQLKLVDREVLMAACPQFKKTIKNADKAYADPGIDSSKTVADLVMVVEGWHLRSGKDATDGRHTIACTSGIVFDEQYDKDDYPFVFLHYSARLLGFWAQGLAEQLMGTQMEINSLLYTISKAIKLIGVPRVFIEDGSKVVKAHNNNEVGTIITYSGTKPSYEVAPCVPQEMYAQLQRLIDYGYKQCGVSAMQASAQKPAGLESGEAIRSYDDISTDRMAALAKRYDNVFIDLAYKITDLARDISIRDGRYSTVYPNKNGTKQIDLPNADMLKDPFVIQCFNTSSLPRDPAGRMQKITEMIQAGMITIKEGRRLLDYPDLDQVERLANASEERIFQILDDIVEMGKYKPADTFMDLDLANELVVQYINLYGASKLEESKMDKLYDFFKSVQVIVAAAMPLPAPPMAGGAPQDPNMPPAPGGAGLQPAAAPQALPQSPLVPNGNPGGAH